MIICPECGSVDVCGFWEQDLTVAVWHCRACGQRWPVTPGDGVAAAVPEMDKRAVEAVREVVEKARSVSRPGCRRINRPTAGRNRDVRS